MDGMALLSSTSIVSIVWLQRRRALLPFALGIGILFAVAPPASAQYWLVFNSERAADDDADIVSYASLTDMLGDANRKMVSSPGAHARNVVSAGSDGVVFWSVFNYEREDAVRAQIAVYPSLADMLADTNRTGTYRPGGAARNLVGVGSDGKVYWSVFNREEESAVGAHIVTYASLSDLLADKSRTGVGHPGDSARHLVGSDSDGATYWNVFNVENENSSAAEIATYASLADMLADAHRLAVAQPGPFARNVVGAGAVVVPEPAAIAAAGAGLFAILGLRRLRTPRQRRSTRRAVPTSKPE